jgi:uncharacterized protein
MGALREMLKVITQNIIDEVKKVLISTYDPVAIYLFGSYAWGKPDNQSDLDLCIVIDTYKKDRHQTIVDGYRALFDLDIAKDILIYSKEEFDVFSNDKARFCHKIKHEGRRIYAKA